MRQKRYRYANAFSLYNQSVCGNAAAQYPKILIIPPRSSCPIFCRDAATGSPPGQVGCQGVTDVTARRVKKIFMLASREAILNLAGDKKTFRAKNNAIIKATLVRFSGSLNSGAIYAATLCVVWAGTT